MAEEWWSLPPLKVGWEWLKNWVETNIWNPVTDVFRLFKEKATEAGAWLLNGVQTIRAALAEIHSRILHGVHVAIATAGEAIGGAAAWVKDWALGKLAEVWTDLNKAWTFIRGIDDWFRAKWNTYIAPVIDSIKQWALGKLAEVWTDLNKALTFILNIDDWFISQAKKFIEASAALLYDVLLRFIDLIW